MEAAVDLNSHLLSSANHPRQPQPHYVRAVVVPAMATATSPTLRHLRSANISQIVRGRLRDRRPFCAANPSSNPTVGDGEKRGETADPLPPPPPPERPLPGDCCGSGCVRCVWDAYHEELQAYKILCQAHNSKSQIESKTDNSDCS